jgi:hypothetical protein
MNTPRSTTSPASPQTIYFDEAGYTGNKLLDRDQPYFVYASVAIDETEARQTVIEVTLSMGAVFNMPQHWGQEYGSIKLVCDRSKPLKVHEAAFNAMIGRKDKAYMDLGGTKYPLIFNLAEPIALVDSHTTPGVQIADVIASATAHALRKPSEEPSGRWLSIMEPHIGRGSVTTDLNEFQPERRDAFVGTMILNELVKRAAKQENLFTGMADVIEAAYDAHYLFLRSRAYREE